MENHSPITFFRIGSIPTFFDGVYVGAGVGVATGVESGTKANAVISTVLPPET
jgi:hypothetical protein